MTGKQAKRSVNRLTLIAIMYINNINWHARSIIKLSQLCQDLPPPISPPSPTMCLLPSLVAVGSAAGQWFRSVQTCTFFEPQNGSEARGSLEIDVRVWELPMPQKERKNLKLRWHFHESYWTAVVIVHHVFSFSFFFLAISLGVWSVMRQHRPVLKYCDGLCELKPWGQWLKFGPHIYLNSDKNWFWLSTITDEQITPFIWIFAVTFLVLQLIVRFVG